jgi:transketolase
MNNLKKQLLEYSFEQGLSHIPSAMSMIDYLDVLFTSKAVTPNDHIVLGKPFGAQAYYLVWRNLGYLDKIEHLSAGVKHDEISFVDFSEETMGNALGVAAGIAMATDKRVWVNLSDATLQMGNALEAIQFIGHNKLKNIFVTIDYNNAQVTGHVDNILPVHPCIQFFKEYGWWTQEVDGHNKLLLNKAFFNLVDTAPCVVFCHTRKGHGVSEIERDIKKWHYKKIETLTELQSLVAELQDT